MTVHRIRIAWVSIILVLLILSPVPWVLMSFEGRLPEQRYSHAFGAMSLMCMSISLILTARPNGIDALFGGLDKAYLVHKWLGLGALATLLIHDTLESEVDGLKSAVTLWGLDWHSLGSDMGVWVYNGLLALLAVTFLWLVPYRIWYMTHRLMVVLFGLSVLHFIVIPKPLSLSDVGGVYLLAWCILGFIAALMALRPASWRGGVPYTVESVSKIGNMTSMWLVPEGTQEIRYRAGQFVTLRGTRSDLTSWHPFTLSSAPDLSGRLRITFASRGKWTTKFAQDVQKHDTVHMRGPHGRFFAKPGPTRQIWLSAGVGLTPHLAWIGTDPTPQGPVDIIHVCSDKELVPHLDELESYAQKHEQVTLKVYETKARGRPTPQDFLRLFRDRDEKVDIYFCGPKDIVDVFRKTSDLARKLTFDIYRERFEFRTELPLPYWLQSSLQTLRNGEK